MYVSRFPIYRGVKKYQTNNYNTQLNRMTTNKLNLKRLVFSHFRTENDLIFNNDLVVLLYFTVNYTVDSFTLTIMYTKSWRIYSF